MFALFGEFLMGEEAENALTVVGRYANDAFLGDGRAVVTGLATRAGHQSATIKIDEYGQGIGCGLGGSPDIEVEAVLAAGRATERHVAEDIGLHGVVTKLLGLAYAFPGQGRSRRLPAEIAYRGLCEGNAQEFLYAILFKAFKDAILGFNLKGNFLALLCASTQENETGKGQHC